MRGDVKANFEFPAGIALTVGAAAWFAVLAASAVQTSHPIVLADEAVYLLSTLFGYSTENFARWEIIGQIPNHLYYRIYSAAAGPDIYFYAKLLNAAFIAATALPAYATARLYLPRYAAAIFAAAVICEPMSSFARYFMPECLYYFGFWCFIYLVLGPTRGDPLKSATAAGMALGLLSLIKPHALALAVGTGAYLALRPSRWVVTIAASSCLAVVFVLTRVAVRHALNGTWDFSVSGPTYGGAMAISRFNPATILFNAMGHAAGLWLLAGIPLVSVFAALIRPKSKEACAVYDLALLAVCLIVPMVAMTIYFSYAVYLIDPVGERISRLHGRYYAWSLPLVMLAYSALVNRRMEHSSLFSNRALMIFGFTTVLALTLLISNFEADNVDYAQLGKVLRRPVELPILALGCLVCLAVTRRLWQPVFPVDHWRRAVPVLWWASIVLATSLVLAAEPIVGGFAPNDIDKAMAVSPLRDLRHRDDGMVIGTRQSAADAYRVLFHLASRSRGKLVPTGTAVASADVPTDVKWLILLPGVAYMGQEQRIAAGALLYIRMAR